MITRDRVRRLSQVIARRARGRLRPVWPPVGSVRLGGLNRLEPISRNYGFDRGTPVDRHYIETFLQRHRGSPHYGAGDIRGRVLEVGGDTYARRYGAPDAGGETRVDVLHVDDSNPAATVVGDLSSGTGLPTGTFDCVICTQTLHVVWDFRAAIRHLHQMLKPGGVLLATVPGITPSCNPDRDLWGDYWRFTTLSFRRLLEEAFPPAQVHVEAYGNVLSSIAFLHGLAATELTTAQLSPRDPDYELVIVARARKAA
jgi:SAM-dependent methyltransferase